MLSHPLLLRVLAAQNTDGTWPQAFAASGSTTTSLASTVARAGVLPLETQASQTLFISAKVLMSAVSPSWA